MVITVQSKRSDRNRDYEKAKWGVRTIYKIDDLSYLQTVLKKCDLYMQPDQKLEEKKKHGVHSYIRFHLYTKKHVMNRMREIIRRDQPTNKKELLDFLRAEGVKNSNALNSIVKKAGRG